MNVPICLYICSISSFTVIVALCQLGEYSYAATPDASSNPQGRREVGGRREEREESEREEEVEGVRQVGEHTATVHVEDKNDLLIPSLPPFPPSLPPSPSPLSPQLHKSSTSIYMTPARDETSLYAQFRTIKIRQISRDTVKYVTLT